MITKPVIYTEEFVKKELDDIYSESLQNPDVVVLGEILQKKPYSSQRFSEWAKKFKDNEEISESIRKIKDLFETRVNVGGLKNKLNPTMAIFNLKNNYGWRDKTEQETTIIAPKPLMTLNELRQDDSNKKDSEPDETD